MLLSLSIDQQKWSTKMFNFHLLPIQQLTNFQSLYLQNCNLCKFSLFGLNPISNWSFSLDILLFPGGDNLILSRLDLILISPSILLSQLFVEGILTFNPWFDLFVILQPFASNDCNDDYNESILILISYHWLISTLISSIITIILIIVITRSYIIMLIIMMSNGSTFFAFLICSSLSV